MGARFAKWRAVIRIADGLPSAGCMSANAHALGRNAALCQEQHLLPIVEPEVLMDGSRYHSSAMQIPKYMAGYQNRQSAQWNNIAVRVNYLWKVAVKFWEATTSISAHLRRPEFVPCGDLRPPPDPAPASAGRLHQFQQDEGKMCLARHEVDIPGAERARVIDFGVCQIHAQGSDLPMTSSHANLGLNKPAIGWMSVSES